MKRTAAVFLGLVTTLLSIFFLTLTAFADGGAIMIDKRPEITLEESAQNAIVAWNEDSGEEILILSKDLLSNSDVKVLDFVPITSNPIEVEEADFEWFEKLKDLVNSKLELEPSHWHESLESDSADGGAKQPAAEITFHEVLGAHDVSVAKVNTPEDFKAWTEHFCEEKGLGTVELTEDFTEAVLHYTSNDINHFVLDVIDVSGDKGSVRPLLYRFKSDSLFYPMRLTADSDVGGSMAELNLFLITKHPLSSTVVHQAGLDPSYSQDVYLNPEELNSVSEELDALMDEGGYVEKASYAGYWEYFDEDISIGSGSGYYVEPYDVEIIAGSDRPVIDYSDDYIEYLEGKLDDSNRLLAVFGVVSSVFFLGLCALMVALIRDRKKQRGRPGA